MTPLVEVDGLEIAFSSGRRGRNVNADVTIRPIDLVVNAGEVCLVRGSSRSGKSALLGAIAGYHRPSKGSVATAEIAHRSGGICVVPQSISLIEGLTIGENIFIASRLGLTDAPDSTIVERLLEELGLVELLERTPGEVSYGEGHRVMLARSLCTRPTILLVDEPFAHQDPEMCDTIAGLVTQYASSSTCCIVTSRRISTDGWPTATTSLELETARPSVQSGREPGPGRG